MSANSRLAQSPETPQSTRIDYPGEWTTPIRGGLTVALENLRKFKAEGQRYNHISEKDVRGLFYGVPQSTADTWVKQHKIRRPGKMRKGRPPILDADMRQIIREYIEDNGYEGRASSWEEICDVLDLPVAPSTLRRVMNKEGLRKFKAYQTKYLTDKAIEARKAFCNAHSSWTEWDEFWKYVIFTDETHIAPGQRNSEYVIREIGQRYHPDCAQFKKKRNDAYFHCWAAVGWNYKSKLVIYGEGSKAGNITQKRYLEDILQPHVLPLLEAIKQRGERCILEEDNDGGHGTRGNGWNACKEARDGYEVYANPPNSPDLSPIENVWRVLKQRVKRRKATSINELRRVILEEWDGISQTLINKYVGSMPERIAECLRNEGKHTRF